MLDVTQEYMAQMDSAMNDKELMLNYVVGNTVMDMGCGSGALLTQIHRKYPKMNRIGIDKDLTYLYRKIDNLSALRSLKSEFDNLQLIQDDVCNLTQHVASGDVDTFVFSSILHEVYSYNNFDYGPVRDLIMNAISLLPVGGRLIIRDGVKPSTDRKVFLTFTTPSDVQKVFRYAKDFKGSNIKVVTMSNDTVSMNERDAMEFLYTYTWGEEHYEREVQEKYGLWNPKGWITCVEEMAIKAHCDVRLVTYNHYLQEGYNYYLSKRVQYTDENNNRLRLPDSNGLFIFEKR